MSAAVVDISKGIAMKIVGARRSKRGYLYEVACGCGHTFKHHGHVWLATCPRCKKGRNMDVLRGKWRT